MTTETRLPIDDELEAALAGDIAAEAIEAMWAEDSRRTLFGMLRQARAIQARLDADEQWLALQRREVERKNESPKRSLLFLEEQIKRLAEDLLAPGSKHVDVPGAGRVQYRDLKAALHITDADAFMESLGPDERASMVEMRPHLITPEAKKYAEAVLETEGGVLLPGVEQVAARRTSTIEYEGFGA